MSKKFSKKTVGKMHDVRPVLKTKLTTKRLLHDEDKPSIN